MFFVEMQVKPVYQSPKQPEYVTGRCPSDTVQKDETLLISSSSLYMIYGFFQSALSRDRFLFTEKLNFYETNQCSIS